MEQDLSRSPSEGVGNAAEVMILLIQGPKHMSHPYNKSNRDTEAVGETLDLLLK